MYAWTIIFLVALFVFDRGMGKRFPKFYRCIQLPVKIIAGVLATAYCALLIYALHEVLNSGVSGGDKLFFALLVLASLGAFTYMTASLWRRWLKERKEDGDGV